MASVARIRKQFLCCSGLASCFLVFSGSSTAAADIDLSRLPPSTAKTVDFTRDVFPLLGARCLKCHQGASPSSGFRLDQLSELLGETNGKPLVRIGASNDSRLIHLVSGRLGDDEVMPPKGRGQRLTAAQVGLLRAWIDQGLKWDDALLPPAPVTSTHWAFQPVSKPPVPQVKNDSWVDNPIDAFIAAGHQVKGLTPVPEAPRRVLIRRLALDLTGLPPAPAEVNAFLADRSPDAYERLVERLLASPNYGERWGRHWLDLARWAESEGYESNHLRPQAWRYRDYVVRSFNADKPYNLFVREQLAGDELTPYSDENLIATGLLAAARLSSNEEDKMRQRNDVLVDVVNAMGNALLGLTINCAQCHNHKFDPITARDYYRLLGFFVKSQPASIALKDAGLVARYEAARPPAYEPARQLLEQLRKAARDDLFAQARKSLSAESLQALAIPEDQRTPDQERLAQAADLRLQISTALTTKAIREEDRKLYDELQKKIDSLEARMPEKPQTFAIYSPASSPTPVEVLPMKGFYPLPYEPTALARARAYLLVRGDVHQRQGALNAGWPEIFGPVPQGAAGKTPRRAILADWLTAPGHPLTARVWVNRLWHYHFGRGLVATPSDFGIRGSPPTHPELLDWLATELVRCGWSTKHLQRLIVSSNTYRQSALAGDSNAERDPTNALWWRWSPHRLQAEIIRDSMLAVSGELDRTMGGPSMADEAKGLRRSLYLLQKRDNPPALQSLFDGPAAVAESCACRHVSTVPLQALYLMNNDFAFGRAKAFARRVLSHAGHDRVRQVETSFALALGRPPDDVEREAARQFFENQKLAGSDRQEPPLSLVHFCQSLLNLDEFIYLE